MQDQKSRIGDSSVNWTPLGLYLPSGLVDVKNVDRLSHLGDDFNFLFAEL
jgi:hypothetical protein